MYCKLFSEEYEKLIDLYKTKRNEDLILARLEGGANPMILKVDMEFIDLHFQNFLNLKVKEFMQFIKE